MSDSREEFEKWAAFDLMAHDFERGKHGEYLDDFLQHSWLGWEAKAARAQDIRLPDEIETDGLRDPANLAYCDGWNDCRKEALSHGMVRSTPPNQGEPQ